MRRVCVLLLGVLGCTDDGPTADPYRCVAAGGAGCFEFPTAVVEAADAAGAPVPIALECPVYEVTTASVTATGRTVDATDQQVTLGGVRLEAYADTAMAATVFDVVSDDAGTWAATNGAMPSLVHVRSTADGQLPLYLLHRRLDLGAPSMIEAHTATRAQVEGMVKTVGDRIIPGKAQLAVTAYDCSGNRVVNAITNVAPVSARAGTRRFEPEVRVYYGSSTEAALPVPERRTELMQTTPSGAAVLTNVAPGTHFVQLWGFLGEADVLVGGAALKLLAESEIQVFEESGVLLGLHARI